MAAQQQFIETHKQAVVNSAQGTGLFPSVIMAQMIVESGWGKDLLPQKANNYFGVKSAGNWSGKTISLPTPKDKDKVSSFRVYPTAQDSLVDHNRFLVANSRYPKAGVFTATTPEEQIKAIAKAGYAESKTYEKDLIGIINKYNLKSLDGMQGYKAIDETKKHPIVVIVATITILISAYLLIWKPKFK